MTHRSGDEPTPSRTVIVAGCTHGGLSVLRSLGRRGLHMVAMTYLDDEPGLHSKYVSEVARCPHPRDEDDFIQFLLDNAERWAGALILETNDHYATALSKHKDLLSEHYRLVVPEWSVARQFIEKDLTYALAERCGIGFPKSIQPRTVEQFDEEIGQIALPAMVKPVRSHEFVAHFRTKLFVADDADELRRRFVEATAAGMAVVVSEVIPGDDYKTLERVSMYIDSTGEILSEMYNTKLRQTPPMFGMNKVSRTTPMYDEVRAASIRMLREAGFRGAAGVEFKRDSRDGSLKLIEINIRLLADTQLSIAAGVDLPWIIYQDLVDDVRSPVLDHDQETYYVHLLTDAFEFLTKERHRLRNLRRFAEPYLARKRTYAYLSRDDPRPFVSEARARVVRLAGKLTRR